MEDSPIARRKADHLALAREGDVGFRQTRTLLDQVRLVHEALPDLSLEQIDTSVELFGKKLRAPLIIAAMTGGSPEAARINRELALIAQKHGYGFGLGSQRAMLDHPELTSTFQVRDVAPDALLLGNIGLVQARATDSEQLTQMLRTVGADALCVHMNPAMEVVQPEGDRDFRGGLKLFERLVCELPLPVIAKETGCGVSYSTASRLRKAGVRHVDVSGAGGTSWVAVETMRAPEHARSVGETLREWGIPTAASVGLVVLAGMDTVIATGGIETGLDAARAIALGASAVGVARPLLKTLASSGARGAEAWLQDFEQQLRAVMLLVGAARIGQLQRVPHILGTELREWLQLASQG